MPEVGPGHPDPLELDVTSSHANDQERAEPAQAQRRGVRGREPVTGPDPAGARPRVARLVRLPRSWSGPVAVLLVGQALGSIGGAAVFSFLPLYAQSRYGADIVTASLGSSIYFAAAAVASLLGGELADRYGRRHVIAAGLGLGGCSALALCLAPSLGLMMAAAGAAGFFDSLPLPALQAVVADVVSPADRSVVYGRMYQAMGFGWFVGPAVAGVLIGRLGYTPAYVAGAAALFVAMLLVLGRLAETRPESRTHTLDRAGAPAPAPGAAPAPVVPPADAAGRPERGIPSGVAASAAPRSGTVDRSRRRFLPRLPAWTRDERLLVVVLLYLLATGVYIQIFTVFPAEGLGRNHLGLTEWGAVLALNGAMILAGQGLVSRLVKQMHPHEAIAWGTSMWVLGFAILSLLAGPAPIVLAMVIFTAGEMVIFPLQPAVVAELAGEEERGRYQGALALGGSIGNALAPAAAGVAVAAIGPAWWLVLAAASGLLAVAYLRTAHMLPAAAPNAGRDGSGVV